MNFEPVPWLGVFLRGGLVSFDGTSQEAPEKWDNNMYFGGAGPSFNYHITKAFEVGAELYGGIGYSSFPSLITDNTGSPVQTHTWNFVSGAALKLTLNPTFNLSIDIAPSLRLQQNLGGILADYAPLTKFNGFAFGIGISVGYQIGRASCRERV